MLRAREGFCEVSDARKRWALEPSAGACLECGEGVKVSITGLQEEFV